MGYVENPPIEDLAAECLPEDTLMHYGIKRRSGRYPWGSGKNPNQHSGDFLTRVEELKTKGMNDKEIMKTLDLSTKEYRALKGIAEDERRALQVSRAKALREDGLSLNAIAKEMGFKNDSSVRALLDENAEIRMKKAKETADFIREQIETKGMIDIGSGVERELGISKEKLDQAQLMLEIEGYPVYGGRVPQVTNAGRQTTLKVICPKGTQHKDIYNYEDIHSLTDYKSYDDGKTFKPSFQYPASMDSKRLAVRYAEDGGTMRDGMIELRRGVPDLSLGDAHYAQVRILVDGKKYLKGMAVYSDDLPDGVDVRFNTNKSKKVSKLDTLKDIKTDDPLNPFGSAIKEKGGQSYYKDPKTGKEKLSLINKRADEGDWQDWKDTLSAQFLSKQPIKLAKNQLNEAIADKMMEFDDISKLTNPTIKKQLLQSFADDCDSSAVHLRAAALPRQKYQVILSVPELKDTEIYAPNFNNGEKLALVRYPHGGTFEIPVLTVNNKNPSAKKLMGSNATDAVGINHRVAERLSGADFDGDTVMAIPISNKVKIKSTPQLEGLKDFDPKMSYATEKIGNDYYNARGEKVKIMSKKLTQTEMGKISNLITDMTIKGADENELARAVRHSMVVIDAEKHKLDYKSSERENGIAELRNAFQDGGGASTIVSRAKGETRVDKRQGSPIIDPKTGKVSYKTADDLYYDVTRTNKRTGEVTTITKKRQDRSTKMAETDDAFTLVSKANTEMERAYATYANKMKAMANEARKMMLSTGNLEYSSSANKAYAKEVKSLMDKLAKSESNAPRERRAQTIANAEIKALKQDNPDLANDKSTLKKLSQQALTRAREKVGAKRHPIEITDKEWEAIQAGAISETRLKKMLKYADMDVLRQKATPRTTVQLSQGKINRLKNMAASGLTNAEIAKALGISASTVSQYLKGKE